jgi:hypothetical protein
MGWIVDGIGRLTLPSRSETLNAETAEDAEGFDFVFLIVLRGAGATASSGGSGSFLLSVFSAAFAFSAFNVFFLRR